MSDTATSPLVPIKPSAGLRVRKPNGQLLDPAGEAVEWNSYWRRRELDGDIERVKPKATRKAATTPAPTAVDSE